MRHQTSSHGHAQQPIADPRYEELRRQLVALERAGQWNSDEAVGPGEELVELERLLPEEYVHEDDEWIA